MPTEIARGLGLLPNAPDLSAGSPVTRPSDYQSASPESGVPDRPDLTPADRPTPQYKVIRLLLVICISSMRYFW